MPRAADLLVDCLSAHGFDRLFCVPGESYLALLDALVDRGVDVVVCRHEGGAGLMALADAKLARKPGLVAVSRGPGATNLSIALHSAEQDAVPLVALIGQVATWERHRGAFQEVDYTAFLGPLCKYVEEVSDPARLPEALARAVHAAQTGTPGPVALALPEDMLEMATDAPVVRPLPIPRAAPAEADVARAADLLARAERPLLIAGSSLDAPEARAALARAAEAHRLPVALTFKQQHLFDNENPLYAGHLGFKIPAPQVQALAEADLILAVGTRLGDTPTQGWQLPKTDPDQPVVHVHADPAVIGRVIRAELGIAADPAAFLAALAERNLPVPEARAAWAARLNERAAALRHPTPKPRPDGLDFGHVIKALAARAPHDAIVSMDAGNFSGWIHANWPWDGAQQAVGAVGGAMGGGVPGAVAASLRFPERRAIGVSGDGGALMTGSELSTAVAAGAKPIIVISDNGTYGTIRLHQEKAFPNRVSGTALKNPDFAAWGASFGALGLAASTPEEAEAAAEAAFAHDGPVVIHAKTSAEAISPFATITQLRGG
ncbi:MAG: thiamine pyrophosphate-dependent enzyme [Pseudomonadota bacterium]